MNLQDDELGALIRSQATYHEAPPELHAKIGKALEQVTRYETVSKPKTTWSNWWNMGAAFAAGLMLACAGMWSYGLLAQQDQLDEQLVDSHVRSLMVAHLSDVVSTDQHTVKPWFDGKLDYAPPVQDLASQGFPLAGGRLDYLNGRTVAALVYRHRSHVINLFVWPAQGKSALLEGAASRQGFNLQSWQDDGMEFRAVSDVQATDLQTFARLLRASLQTPTPMQTPTQTQKQTPQ